MGQGDMVVERTETSHLSYHLREHFSLTPCTQTVFLASWLMVGAIVLNETLHRLFGSVGF